MELAVEILDRADMAAFCDIIKTAENYPGDLKRLLITEWKLLQR